MFFNLSFLVSIVMNFVNLGILMCMENTNVDVICSSYLAKGKNGLFIFLAWWNKNFPKKKIKLKPMKLFWLFHIPYITHHFDPFLLFFFLR